MKKPLSITEDGKVVAYGCTLVKDRTKTMDNIIKILKTVNTMASK